MSHKRYSNLSLKIIHLLLTHIFFRGWKDDRFNMRGKKYPYIGSMYGFNPDKPYYVCIGYWCGYLDREGSIRTACQWLTHEEAKEALKLYNSRGNTDERTNK